MKIELELQVQLFDLREYDVKCLFLKQEQVVYVGYEVFEFTGFQ